MLMTVLIVALALASPAGAEPDWKAMKQALGEPGQLMPGGKAAITGDFVLIDREVNDSGAMT
jgi:hypothetical protein